MSKQVRMRRGTAAQHAAFIGADGEVTVDIDSHELRVHDGITPGGLAATAALRLTPETLDTVQVLSGALTIAGGTSSAPGLIVSNRAVLAGPTVVTDLQTPVIWLGSSGISTIDFAAGRMHVVALLAGDMTFITANRLAGRMARVFVRSSTAPYRNLSWPAGWRWQGGAVPTQIQSLRTGWLELQCLGVNDADILARWTTHNDV
jgi:hypothetical protein